jgi:hypothetical protein
MSKTLWLALPALLLVAGVATADGEHYAHPRYKLKGSNEWVDPAIYYPYNPDNPKGDLSISNATDNANEWLLKNLGNNYQDKYDWEIKYVGDRPDKDTTEGGTSPASPGGGFEPWIMPRQQAPAPAEKRPAGPASRPTPTPRPTPNLDQPAYPGKPPSTPESDPGYLYKRALPPTSQADTNPRLVMVDGPKPATAPKGVAMKVLIGQATLKRAEAPRQLIADIRAGD